MKSMTGYGYSEIKKDKYICKIKIQAVNQKFFEVTIKLPHDLLTLESRIKEKIQEVISRGRISVFLDLEKESNSGNYKIDMDIFRYYYDLIKKLNDEFNLNDNIKVIDILTLKDIIKFEKPALDSELIWPLIKDTLSDALNVFEKMRIEEGIKLKSDILNRINILEEFNLNIKNQREELKNIYRNKLEKRLNELLPDVSVNETLVKLEFALFIDKSDITEETVRIESHLNQFNQIINKEDIKTKGRHLDFVCQELNREFNTIGTKANFYKISDLVIQAKCELEKIREQLQNVE